MNKSKNVNSACRLRRPTTTTKKIYDQIDSYLAYCEEVRQFSVMTLQVKKSDYQGLIRDTKITSLEELTNEVMDDYIAKQLRRGCCPRTINLRNTQIVVMVKWFRDMGEIAIPLKIPLVHQLKEGVSRRIFYSRDEIDQVLDCADELSWLLIRIAFDTGMRMSELARLSLSEINGLRINFVGKGSRPREVYLTKETHDKLKKWVEKNHTVDYLWWNHERNRRYSTDELRIRMKKAFEAAGYDNFYPHSLRHSFATDIQKQGASVMELKEMLGHSSVATTQRYIHGLDGQLGNLFAKYRDPQIVMSAA